MGCFPARVPTKLNGNDAWTHEHTDIHTWTHRQGNLSFPGFLHPPSTKNKKKFKKSTTEVKGRFWGSKKGPLHLLSPKRYLRPWCQVGFALFFGQRCITFHAPMPKCSWQPDPHATALEPDRGGVCLLWRGVTLFLRGHRKTTDCHWKLTGVGGQIWDKWKKRMLRSTYIPETHCRRDFATATKFCDNQNAMQPT